MPGPGAENRQGTLPRRRPIAAVLQSAPEKLHQLVPMYKTLNIYAVFRHYKQLHLMTSINEACGHVSLPTTFSNQ